MVNHSIKVYARLKREDNVGEKGAYEIVQKKAKFDDVIFYGQSMQQGNTPYSFRKVFRYVLQGFNGTIFAYGQTGSGKTYTITGSPKNYNDRGIIPRSIQYIFAENEKVSVKPTIYISYMEIYNEVGYDLLSSRQNNTARSLEDLPRIALLEDGKGEAHIRNLSVLPVTTEQEAMRLLFLGDTNRTIAETPMNEYSSRSHCIFTIYITFRNEPTNVIRFSKLHLVDLAGSERVSKSLTTGTALNEAKHINLSLHYLQQVILALSESKRSHIPYRNSMMTYLLKDSLSGNCLTAMLATLSVSKYNVLETLSTCRFAQRVSLISTEPVINEICDPHQEIVFLKNKIDELRKQISALTGFTVNSTLTKEEEQHCREEVDNYLNSDNSNEELKVKSDLRQIQLCFKIMKRKINSQCKETMDHKLKYDKSQKELSILKEAVDKKEAEITTLKTIIDNIPEHPVNPDKSLSKIDNNLELPESAMKTSLENVIKNELCCGSDLNANISFEDEKQLFDKFMLKPENAKDLKYYTHSLEKKWKMAKIYADTIEQCQKNIIYVRQKLQGSSDSTIKNQLVQELEEQQNIYRKSLADLKTVKNETDHLQSGLKQAEIKTMQKFKIWLEDEKAWKHGNILTEICWSEAHKPLESNKDTSNGCCSKKCNCRPKQGNMCINCTGIYCRPEAFCSDFKRSNLCHIHNHVQNHLPKKSDRCGCSKDAINQSPKPQINHKDPCLFHPVHSEMGHTNYEPLRIPNGYSKPAETINFQHEELPVCPIHSCGNVDSNLVFNNRSNDFLDNINILIETVDKNDKNYYEKRREKCEHNVENNKHTKVCCQLFCCDNLNRGNIYLAKDRCTVIRNNQSCCEHEQRNFISNIPSSNFEDETADDEELCEPYYGDPSCDDISFINEPKCTNSEETYMEERELVNNCQVQTNETSGVEDRVDVIAEAKAHNGNVCTLFKQSDSAEFREFMKTVPLTGERDIDEEIYKFYRNKFCA